MNDTLRHNDESHTDIFKNNDMPPRGFISEIMTIITRPIVFFSELGNRQSAPYTKWIAILILLLLSVTALQIPASTDVALPNVIGDGGISFDGTLFDPGFPPDDEGIDTGIPSPTDTTAQWTLVLTTISKQLIIWGALTIILSLVTLANGYMPPFSKNLEIAIWASVPLALMAGLQMAFMSGGGTITATGLSGFLDDWETFATFDLRLQSIVHAFSEQMTLFWLWGLWLLYVGMRFTLRGKLAIVLFILVMWIALFGLVNSFRSYDILSSSLPTIEEQLPEGFMPADDFPPMDMPLTQYDQPDTEQIITDIDGEASIPIENIDRSSEGT